MINLLNSNKKKLLFLHPQPLPPCLCVGSWIEFSHVCIPSFSAIASRSLGRIGMSRSGLGYNSGLLWSSGCFLTPTSASSIGISGSSVNSPSSYHRSRSTSSGLWQTTSSPNTVSAHLGSPAFLLLV